MWQPVLGNKPPGVSDALQLRDHGWGLPSGQVAVAQVAGRTEDSKPFTFCRPYVQVLTVCPTDKYKTPLLTASKGSFPVGGMSPTPETHF